MPAPGVPDPGVSPPGDGVIRRDPNAPRGPDNKETWKNYTDDGLLSIPGLDGLSDGVNAVHGWISDRHNWTRTAWFATGAVLFILGAAVIARPAVQSAASIVPTGKILKAVGK